MVFAFNFTFIADIVHRIQSFFEKELPLSRYDCLKAYFKDDFPSIPSLSFTEFQLEILKSFIIVLLIVSLLIVYYWYKYGDVITERFIRPISGTLKEIEELKLSVAKLKLPKEHTPRI